MIVCRKCNRRHGDGTEFCACGAYLEFDGEHVADPEPADAGRSDPARTDHGAPGTRPAGTTHDERVAGTPADPSRAASPASSADPGPWSGFASPDTGTGRRDGGIGAVLPDAPTSRPDTDPVWVEPAAREGDTGCRRCGTSNPAEHQFCRHCGASLTGAFDDTDDAAATDGGGSGRRRSWRRRLTRAARSRARRGGRAGGTGQARHLGRGGLSWRALAFRSGGLLLVIASVLALAGPWRRPLIDRGQQALGATRYDAIDLTPDEVSAVTAVADAPPVPFPLQGADNVVDRFANTAWATRWLDATGSGFADVPDEEGCQPAAMTDSFLRFEFAEPTDLSRVRILPGRPEGDPSRTLFLRPRVVELRADDRPCEFVVLPDAGELSAHRFEHDDVAVVEVRIVGVYEPDDASVTVEISEIVFDR